MKKFLATTITLTTLLFLCQFTLSAQSDAFKTGKNLDIQYSILREIAMTYVDSVKMDKLIETGIHAMLSTLDPYSVWIPEEDDEEIERMTIGSYGGVGAIIQKLPSGNVLVSEPYFGSPSDKAGMVPGDQILAVDGVSVLDITINECSSRMKGEAGTSVVLTILKIRGGDTVDIKLTRERIRVSDILYSGIIQDSIGYIVYNEFSNDGYKEFIKALEQLQATGKMKRLIVDLRGNGGGLMEEAINVVSQFVPKGTLAVSSRGKIEYMNEEYHTKLTPLSETLPLMVMVNSGSASSSEIVAGALQDMDRAVIAGSRTFGKGLIQNLRNVGYNTSLKLTTGKYYTPSGRCVQAIDYSNRNEDGSVGYIPDSLRQEFKTKNGRSVYDGGGIMPDIETEGEYFSRPLVAMVYSGIVSDFAIKYFGENISIAAPGKFSMSDADYEEFIKYAVEKDFDSRTYVEIEFERVLSSAKREGLYELNQSYFDDLKSKISMDKETFLRKMRNEIQPVVEQEIVHKYYYATGAAEYGIRGDKQLKAAIEKWNEVKLNEL